MSEVQIMLNYITLYIILTVSNVKKLFIDVIHIPQMPTDDCKQHETDCIGRINPWI